MTSTRQTDPVLALRLSTAHKAMLTSSIVLLVGIVCCILTNAARSQSQPRASDNNQVAASESVKRVQLRLNEPSTALVVSNNIAMTEAMLASELLSSTQGNNRPVSANWVHDAIKHAGKTLQLANEALAKGYDSKSSALRLVNAQMVDWLVHNAIEAYERAHPITKEHLKAEYKKNADRYTHTELRGTRYVVFGSEEEAQAAVAKLKSTNVHDRRSEFRSMVLEANASDEANERSGDLVVVQRDGTKPGSPEKLLDPSIVAAAFSLSNVGDFTEEPLKVGDGWGIVTITSIVPGRTIPFAQVERTILQELKQRAHTDVVDEMIKKAHDEVKPEVHLDRMNLISIPKYEVPATP